MLSKTITLLGVKKLKEEEEEEEQNYVQICDIYKKCALTQIVEPLDNPGNGAE